VGRIRKKYRVKTGRTSGKAKMVLEEWRRSFIIETEVRISLLKLSPVQHEQVNNSYNPEVATYQKHWHFFFPLYFQVGLKPQYVLFDFLSLTSDFFEINHHFIGSSKIRKACIVASGFRKIQFYEQPLQKTKNNNYCFT